MKKYNGFSLIELISVIAIAGIVAAIIGSALTTGFYGYFIGAAMNPLSNQATIAMRRMSTDLANAVSISTIPTNPSSSITFTDGALNTWTYDNTSCGANTLCLTMNGGTPATLASNVSNLAFSFYDSTFAAATTSVKAVTINMTLTGSKNNTVALVNTIYLRNMP